MRPKSIIALHEAKYDLRAAGGGEKDVMLRRYKDALANAAKEFGVMGPQIEAAVAADFGIWVRQEKLPKIPPAINS